jgi:hypothetical protein
MANPRAVVAMEIAIDIAISFAHSQYDTQAFPVDAIAALHYRRAGV